MTGSSIQYNDNNPVSLVDRLINYIACNPISYCVVSNDGQIVKLREDAVLGAPISDKLVSTHAESGNISESFMKLFSDTRKTQLERVKVAGSNISDRSLSYIQQQKVSELDLSNCQKLTPFAFRLLSDHKHLQMLNLENTSIFQGYKMDVAFRRLRLLNVANTGINDEQLNMLLKQLNYLTSLDVSKVIKNGNLKFLDSVRTTLKSLILHDCVLNQESLEYMYTMINLRHLDISNSSDDPLELRAEFLQNICRNLQHITSLDLSGNKIERNLEEGRDGESMEVSVAELSHEKAKAAEKMLEESIVTKSSIEGLRLLHRPLQFLGLLNCPECELPVLPAIKVAGESDEEQVLNSIEAYTKRSSFLLKALNVFFEVVRTSDCNQIPRAANLIVCAMKSHIEDCPIQISGSASLFHISGETYEGSLTFNTKRRIILALLDAMENNTKSLTLQRNCCLTLYNFQLPFDLQFQYERLARILINIINSEGIDGIVERLCVYMCNNIVCHVEGEDKKLMGELGVVQSMLGLIRKRVDRKSYDEVMETAWSTLWNVTDETAENCQKFVSDLGLELFQHCRKFYPEKQDLLRNMMGLMGNVAEVPFLRSNLLHHAETFCELLFDKSDGIEVSYNAAGVLSHILSDGPRCWNIGIPTRTAVIEKMYEAIDLWDINTKRNINYRSFEPIIRLLNQFHTPVCQYWAVWALTNLCKVDPDKYCSLLRMEGGLEKLNGVLSNQECNPKLIDLANQTIDLNIQLLGAYQPKKINFQ